MPHLREWVLHFPSDWTQAQAAEYVRDTTMTFIQAIRPVMHAVGPERAAGILLTAILNMARANPVYHENIKDMMARTYEAVGNLDPLKPTMVKH